MEEKKWVTNPMVIKMKPQNARPQRKTVEAKQRKLPIHTLQNLKCTTTPPDQRIGVGQLYTLPTTPGEKRQQFLVNLLNVFSSQKDADEYKVFLARSRSAERGTYVVMTFPMGYWLSLPVPVWLHDGKGANVFNSQSTVNRINTYNSNSIFRLLKENFDQAIRSKIVRKARTDSSGPYMTADEENKILEPDGTVFSSAAAEEKKDQILEPDDKVFYNQKVLADKFKYGLAWVLPTIQTPGQEFESVAFAWLGAYATLDEVTSARKDIQRDQPEFNVYEFKLGTLLELPVKSWVLQSRNAVFYDSQEVLGEMLRSDNGVAAVEIETRDEKGEELGEETDEKGEEKELLQRLGIKPKPKLTPSPADDDHPPLDSMTKLRTTTDEGVEFVSYKLSKK